MSVRWRGRPDPRLVLALVALLPACATASPPASIDTTCEAAFATTLSVPIPDQPAADHLAYASDIVVLDENLQPGRQLTDDGRSASPDFAPDGTRIVYESGRYEDADGETVGLSSIWVVGVDGQGERQLTRGRTDRFPRWSPDGNRIVFLRQEAEGFQPTLVDADGGTPTSVGPFVYDALDWVSDELLAGVGYDERDYSTYVFQLDVATGAVQRIDTGPDDVGGSVLWSPDGTQFAYVEYVDRGTSYDPSARPTIQVHDLQTGEEHTVPGSDTLENRLVLWTSDDNLLFWQNTRGADYNIALSGDGGTAPARVIGTHRDGQPVGDPDSDNPRCRP